MRKDAPLPDKDIFTLGVPVLGICYGVQLLAQFLGGQVEKGQKREYGKGTLTREGCVVRALSRPAAATPGLEFARRQAHETARAASNRSPSRKIPPFAAIENRARKLFGLQFHPEVVHTPRGREIISNFVHGVCGCGKDWTMRNYIEQAVEEIRAQVGREQVILGLSGGVDSSVAAALLHKAIGDQLTCIFVNNGLLRGARGGSGAGGFRATFQHQAAIRGRLETVPANGSRASPTRNANAKSSARRSSRLFEAATQARRARRSSSRKARFIPT